MPTEGRDLGLTRIDHPLNSTNNPFFFFVVEFDIYTNSWDPPRDHVGIDINSMKSVANVPWLSTIAIRDGKRRGGMIKKMVMPLMTNLEREEHERDFHMINWPMQQIISITKKR